MVSDRLSSAGQWSTIIKYFFVNILNIFTTGSILRWFPSASECEIMTLINKLLHWTRICRFPGAAFVFSTITLWNIDNRCYHDSKLVSGVWEIFMQTPKAHIYVICKQSYGTLPCSGGHFDCCLLAANAQGKIQWTFSMLLRWVLRHRNGVFMFIVSQGVM